MALGLYSRIIKTFKISEDRRLVVAQILTSYKGVKGFFFEQKREKEEIYDIDSFITTGDWNYLVTHKKEIDEALR